MIEQLVRVESDVMGRRELKNKWGIWEDAASKTEEASARNGMCYECKINELKLIATF